MPKIRHIIGFNLIIGIYHEINYSIIGILEKIVYFRCNKITLHNLSLEFEILHALIESIFTSPKSFVSCHCNA